MKKIFIILSLIIFYQAVALPQVNRKIMSYNLLNYPGSDSGIRNPYFRTVIQSVIPDVLVVQEMTSQSGVNGFLTNVLIPVSNDYTAGLFNNGPDTDNAIFYRSSAFTFLSNIVINTDLRDINEFILRENASNDTIRIFSLHLKASTGTSNEQQRLAEVNVLRSITDQLPANSNYIVCGDFNIYSSNEPAYQKLKNQATPGYFVDILNLTGSWNTSSYAHYHTQSPRVRQFGGGSTGGMDDRFDMILMSPSIMHEGGVYYVPGSFVNYGNDGNHYNDSINKPPNTAVGQTIADAIHYSSDHIPVFANFQFQPSAPASFQFSLLVENGWNLVSIPGLNPVNQSINTWWTDRDPSSGVFKYDNTYQSVASMEPGVGYWLNNDGANLYNTGDEWPSSGIIITDNNSINIKAGWNLIGIFNYSVSVANIISTPPNLINGSVYRYAPNDGYQIADSLMPGIAYWIYSNGNGTLNLPNSN